MAELPETLPGFYRCPRCGRVSYNPYDRLHRYCGACKSFEDDQSSSVKSHRKKPKTDPIFGVRSLAELGHKCQGKTHQIPRRQHPQERQRRQRYVLGLEDEAP